MSDPLLKTAQIARLWKCCPQTVRRRLERYAIPHIDDGPPIGIRVRWSEVIKASRQHGYPLSRKPPEVVTPPPPRAAPRIDPEARLYFREQISGTRMPQRSPRNPSPRKKPRILRKLRDLGTPYVRQDRFRRDFTAFQERKARREAGREAFLTRIDAYLGPGHATGLDIILEGRTKPGTGQPQSGWARNAASAARKVILRCLQEEGADLLALAEELDFFWLDRFLPNGTLERLLNEQLQPKCCDGTDRSGAKKRARTPKHSG
jgi:hypothetical protein